MDWITAIVVTVVVGFFLAVLYRALKEPIDLFISWIKGIFSYVGGEVSTGRVVEVIRYD